MKTDLFQSCGYCWVFQICWPIESSVFTASSFRIWNSSIGIPSPLLALFLMMLCQTQWNYESWCVGLPKMDGSWRRVLTKCGQLEMEVANHLSILALRNPWTVRKKNKVYLSKFKFVGNYVHPLFHIRVITHLWQTSVANRSAFKKRIKVGITKVK